MSGTTSARANTPRVIALVSPFIIGVGLLALWMFSHEMGHSGLITTTTFWWWLGLSVAAWTSCAFKLEAPRRVLYGSLLNSLAVSPIFFLFGSLGLSFPLFAAMPTWSRILLWVIFFGGTAFWTWIDFRGMSQRIVSKRFFAREFHDMDTHIEVAWQPKTDLSPPPIGDKTTLGRLYNAHGYKVIAWMLPMGFPIQKLLSGAGGVEAVSAFLFLLFSPLLMWGLKSLFSGAYIWLYCVWKLERETGKKVLYADD